MKMKWEKFQSIIDIVLARERERMRDENGCVIHNTIQAQVIQLAVSTQCGFKSLPNGPSI